MSLKNTEKLENGLVALTVEISEAQIEAGKEKAYKKNGKSITVPGFRKGKATRKMIESLYGAGVFFEDALNYAYPEAYEAAVTEAGVTPVAQAEVSVSDMAEDGTVTIVCTVAVYPEVTLGDYKNTGVEKETAFVSDEEIDEEIARLAERNASVATAERAAVDGDTVVIDFEGFVDGVAFEGGKGENHELKLGSNSFIPGFEAQLVGCAAGDAKDVEVSFPEEYHAEELAGKAAIFKCTVHEVKETVLPTIDDEFAKDVSETAESLDDLKKEVSARLLKVKEETAENAYEEKVLDAVLAGMEADIPAVMYESQIDTLVQDFGYRMQMQGMNMQEYVQMTGGDDSMMRGMFREQAERQVKVRLALGKIAQVENIEVTDDEVEAKYAVLAEQYKMELAKVKGAVPAATLKGDMKFEKAMELVCGE